MLERFDPDQAADQSNAHHHYPYKDRCRLPLFIHPASLTHAFGPTTQGREVGP